MDACGWQDDLACPKCRALLARDVPLPPKRGWVWRALTRWITWWPPARRQRDFWMEAKRRYSSDYELWSDESRRLESARRAHLQTLKEQDEQLGQAIRNQSSQGALDYVLRRHRRVWDENAGRIDSLIRTQYLSLSGDPNTRAQLRRAFGDAVPTLVVDLARAEKIEIRPSLSLERLARTAPDDQGLFAGEWFAAQFKSAFERHIDWKDSHPNLWAERRKRIDPRERGLEFERYLKVELEKAGCERVEMTKTSGDYGADLLIVHGGRRIIIQAKSYSDKVSLDAIQEIEAARKLYRAQEAWVVTDSDFTPNARVLAKENGVQLIDGKTLDIVGPSIVCGRRLGVNEPVRANATLPETTSIRSDSLDANAASEALASERPGIVASPFIGDRFRLYAVHLVCVTLALVVLGSATLWIASAHSKAGERSVLSTVDRWVSATRSLNVDGLLACYAPRLKKFYRLSDVGLDEVAKNKRDAFRKFSETRTYQLRNVAFEHLDSHEAAVVFDKDCDFRDRKSNRRYAGSGRQRLTLERFADSWLITGEEELGVYSTTSAAVGK
jgi:hypothetical protein